MLGTLHTFGDGLAGTELSTLIQNVSGIIPRVQKVIAIASLALWSCIVFAGRWIAYVASY
jgi:hypothetical protein